MKAIVQDRYGSADMLEFQDVEVPAVGADEVLVRVRAAGAGPDVWHWMTGLPLMARPALGFRAPKERIRGWDAAGTVEAVGADVTGFEVGDEVMGLAPGAFAEFAIAKDKLVRKPERLSFEEAAAVPISGITALRAVREKAQVTRGQRVLVIGAAGGVGSLVVQVAKAFGAHVTGVCSTTKVDLVRSIGADAVIDYTREDFAEVRPRFDAILDIAGGRSVSHLRRALARRGTLVIVGGEGGGRWFGGIDRQLRATLLSPFVGQKLGTLIAKSNAGDLAALKELIEDRKVIPVIDRTYPLGQVPDAIRHLERGHGQGKVVITV